MILSSGFDGRLLKGNILKVDGHKYVKVAYHGQKLEKEEEEEYTIKRASELRTCLIDTLFALSECSCSLK